MPRRVLLLLNSRAQTGVGNYSFSLYEALKDHSGLDTEIELHEGHYNSILASLSAFVKIKKDSNLYHICNGQFLFFTARLKPTVVSVHDMLHFREFSDEDEYVEHYGAKYPMYNQI